MKSFRLLLAFAVLGIFGGIPSLVWADDAKEAFETGKALLKEKGDMQAAMHKFVEAVHLDPGVTEYSTMLSWTGRARRLEAMKKADEDNLDDWCKRCRGLHIFYLALGMTKQAIQNDKELCERSKDPDDTIRLAQAYFVDGQFTEAAKVLQGMGDNATPASDAMLVLALDRAGDREKAIGVAKEITVPETLTSAAAYNLARAKAIAGDAKESADLLTALFEATAPVRLEAKKQEVVECKDFDEIRDSAEYQAAMKSESKLSGCSEGKSCATCPMRGQCESGGASDSDSGTNMDATKSE